NAIGILLPLKINKFSNPYNNMVKQDFPCKDKFNDLLKVPHKKMATNSSSDSIFHALGYTLPKCQVITRDGNTHLRISQVAETIKFFHTDNGNRTDIGPDGIAWSPNENGPINLDIEYVDQNGNIISLGTYAITEVEGGASVKLFTWDKTNLQLICTSIPPKTIKPFLDKYWDKVPEVIPVTREFIDLLEANNCHIADYIPTPEEVSFKIVDDNDTTIEFVSRSYSENERIAYAIEDGQDTIYTDMPQLSVFPNYTFTYSKNQVWNKYYFTAIGEGEDAYSYFKKIKLQYKRQGVEDYSNMEFVKKPLLNEDDKTFIAYRSFMTFIPDKIFLLDENGKQFGVILLPKPKKKTLDTDRTAIVGVDMGSRNSIVAYYRKGNDTRINFTYNRNDLIGNVCNDSRPQDQNEREQLLNLHGLSGEPVEKSFTSAVLDYMDCDAIDRTDPMVHGRVVADLSEGSFKKIMGLAKDVTEEPDDGDKLSLIGYHSNFKRNLWTPENEKIRKPCVKLFVRNICYRLLLNAFLNDCGKIELRFTAPNGTVGDRLKGYWIEALGLAKTEFGLPDNISNNISVDDYKLESVALYHHIQNDPDDLPYPYSIIIDGGDSTFDVSMIYKGPDDTTRLCQNFSIKYAGYDLLVKSITKVALKKNYNLDDFISMWVSDDADKKEELKEEIRKLAEVGVGNNNVDWENSKTVEDIVYKLVESSNYGLHKNSTAAKDAVSLVRLKYLLLLNAIIQTCIDSIPIGEISDETTTKNVSVFLYGGANNIAKLLYGDRKSIEKKLGSIMTNWLDRYENPAKVKRIELRYNVNPDKTELVSGLVQTTIDPDDENIKTNPFVPKKYTQATYDDIIKGIFSSEKDSGYWNDDDFILDFPDIVETKPELQGANEEEVMKSCKGAVLKKLGDEDIPNRAVYPLATMFYAVYKFESTFKPEKNK
ncbi:MAG: hypothetical protein K2J26_05865, partial [Ruminococcus sp.]|nr:hypothetical protein [Ruminococcus sp.]